MVYDVLVVYISKFTLQKILNQSQFNTEFEV
jgi:hypothetical protein